MKHRMRSHQQIVAVLSLLCCHPRQSLASSVAETPVAATVESSSTTTTPIITPTTSSSSSPVAATSTSTSTSTSTTSTTTTSTFAERHRDETLKFFRKFESHGPTLTLTLRDPSTTTLLGGVGSSGRGNNNSDRTTTAAWTKLRTRTNRNADGTPKSSSSSPAAPTEDDGSFGISSKLAALFHISSPATSNDETPSSSSSSSSSRSNTSPFADGYMLDDGEIFLDPPSEQTSSSSSSSRGLFSIRDAIDGGWGKSLSEYARNVHPEIRQEIRTREPSSRSHEDDGDDDDDDYDTRPFPASLPWLSGVSCGMIWSPFPVCKTGYPEEGYGHNRLLSAPHFVRCGARISLPRLSAKLRDWRSTSKGIASDFTAMENYDDGDSPKMKELDMGVSYRESPNRPGGAVEVLLGRWRPSLPAASPPPLRGVDDDDDDNNRRRNHLLVRFATGGHPQWKITNDDSSFQKSILSSIEYVKASFRMPTPFFLRNRYHGTNKNRDGVSVSSSFDFAEGIARCVLSGDVGSSGRTRAVLRLDGAEDSTLTIVRSLDESKIIAPTISLNSGKIVYDYYLDLDDGISSSRSRRSNEHRGKANSSMRVHVDPTNGILLKWTDGIRGGGRRSGKGGGSCWVTECRIPLGTTAAGPLAADVRVGRRWVI